MQNDKSAAIQASSMMMHVSGSQRSGIASADDRFISPEHLDSGLIQGTLVMTREGDLPVEYIGIGDEVVTRGAGYAKVTAVNAERLEIEVIRIRGGSLGHSRPGEDILLPAAQKVFVRDWRADALDHNTSAMVSAGRLVDDEFVICEGLRDVTIYQICCDAPHIIYAGGLEVAGGIRDLSAF